MPIVKCTRCPATAQLTQHFRDGQRLYESDYGSDFFDQCKTPVRAAGDPDKTPSCPHMEDALKAEILRLDAMLHRVP